MDTRHVHVLICYGVFLGLSAGLALARRGRRRAGAGPGVWRKYPTFILINLAFLVAAWLPASWHALALLLAALGAGACWEISRALGLGGRERAALPAATAGLVLAAGWLGPAAFLPLWLTALAAGIAAWALTEPGEQLGAGLAALAGGGVYLPLCLASLLWVQRGSPGGFHAVFLAMVIAGNDAFAQITGQLVGGRPLAPRISPGKTVGGAAGGALAAAAVGAALSTTVGWPIAAGACAGVALGAAGQIGDLVESRWKRALGLKDFSGLLGAQGGVLDRFDGLLFAAPLFFALTSL